VATKADFTDEEWRRLGRAPLLAGLAITFADPGGALEALKESSAAVKAVIDARDTREHGPFVREVARDVAAEVQARRNPLAGFQVSRRDAIDKILGELRDVNTLLEAKASPEEADDFRDWVRIAAQGAAKAAKEGGFLGFGGQLVSEREQEMLDKLGAAFGQPPNP
jgi:hypothetical protein